MAPNSFASVARIRDGDGVVCGAGFLAGARHVFTCAHVIDDALSRRRGTERASGEFINLDLPFQRRVGLTGRVVAFFPMRPLPELERDPVADIAVIELSEDFPDGVQPAEARLSPPPEATAFGCWGFPPGLDGGAQAGGELLALDPCGWRHVRDVQDRGRFIEPGFSGAAVIDAGDNRLLGMVVAADSAPERRMAFAVPTATLCRAWPPLAKPYKELFAFEEEDGGLFFGRDATVAELRRKIAERPFSLVIGPSGSGKSSLVRAGLFPSLREAGWALAAFRPGRRPLYRLAHALVSLMRSEPGEGAVMADAERLESTLRRDPGRILDLAETALEQMPGTGRILLLIDQLEELFTHDDPDRVGAETAEQTSVRVAEFVALLAAVSAQSTRRTPPLQCIATLRADFTGRALETPDLSGLLRDADVKLGPMSVSELTEAVERPAGLFGVKFETGLVAEIVARMEGVAGGLPLLQFALDRLWKQQQDRRLTHAGYDRIGGVEGALAEHAGDVLAGFAERESADVRRVFLRLVRLAAPGEQAEDTRAVVSRDELGDADWRIVLRLAGERLVTTGRDPEGGETAELVHEALIRNWAPLRAWLDEDRELGLWRQRLRVFLGPWRRSESGAFLRGDILAEAGGWLGSHGASLNDEERSFIEASLRDDRDRRESERRRAAVARERELQLAREQEEAARRVASRTRIGLAIASVLLVVSLALGWFSVREARRAALHADEAEAAAAAAQQQTARAEQAERDARAEANRAALNEARAEEAASEAGRQARIARAQALAVRARALFERGVGRNATAALLALESLHLGGGAEAQQVIAEILALTPWDVRSLPGVPPLSEVRASPDGGTHYTWRTEGRRGEPGAGAAVAFDPESGRELARIETEGWARATLSPDGRWMAVGGHGRRLAVVDLESGETVFDEARGHLTHSVFSPDSQRLYIAEGDGSLETRLAPDWRLASKTGLHEEAPKNDLHIEISLRGDRLLIAYPHAIYTGPPAGPFSRLPGIGSTWINHGVLGPAGKRIATLTWDNGRKLQLHDAETGEIIARRAHPVWVGAMAFDPTGQWLAIGDGEGTVTLWNAADGSVARTIETHEVQITGIAFSPDGGSIISAHKDGLVRQHETAAGDLITAHERPRPVEDIVSVGSDAAIVAEPAGRVVLLDLVTGAETVLRDPVQRPRNGVAALRTAPGVLALTEKISESAYSRTVLSAVSATDGAEIWRRSINGHLQELHVSPDDTVLAMRMLRDNRGYLALLRAIDGKQIPAPELSTYIGGLFFASGGSRLVVNGTETRVVDPAEGRELFAIGEPGGVEALFALDGGASVVTFGDGELRGWDPATGALRWSRLLERLGYAISGDGSRYALWSPETREIVVHDTLTGRELARLPKRDTSPQRVVLSQDGNRLAARFDAPVGAAVDHPANAIELWALDEPKLLKRLTGLRVGHWFSFGGSGFLHFKNFPSGTFVLGPDGAEVLRDPSQGASVGFIESSQGEGLPLVLRSTDVTRLIYSSTENRVLTLDVGIDFHAVTGDGARMVAFVRSGGSRDGPEIALFDLTDGSEVWAAGLPQGVDSVMNIALTSDEEFALLHVATGDESPVFLLALDLETGTVSRSFEAEHQILEIVPLADPDLFATRDLSEIARVWRISTGEEEHRVAHGVSGGDVRVAANASRAVTWTGGALRVWDLVNGAELDSLVTEGEVGNVAIAARGDMLAYTLDRDERVESGEKFEAIHLHRVGAQASHRRIVTPDRTSRPVFSPNEQYLAAMSADNSIRVWEVATGKPVATIQAPPGNRFSDLKFASFGAEDGTALLIADESGDQDELGLSIATRIWRIAKEGVSETSRIDHVWRPGPLDGTILRAAGVHGARQWDIASGGAPVLRLPKGFQGWLSSGPGRWLIDSGKDALRAFDPETRDVLEVPPGGEGRTLGAAAFSTDMSRAYLAEREEGGTGWIPGMMRVVSVPDGADLASPINPGHYIHKILPVRGGAVLLADRENFYYKRASVWRPGETRFLDLPVAAPVVAEAVSPDGTLLALGMADQIQKGERWITRGQPHVTLWDTRSGRPLGRVDMPGAPASIVFDKAGDRILLRDDRDFHVIPTERLRDPAAMLKASDFLIARQSAGMALPGAFLESDRLAVSDVDALRLVSLTGGEEIVLPHGSNNRDVPRFEVSEDGRVMVTKLGSVLRVWKIPAPEAVIVNPRTLLLARYDLERGDRTLLAPNGDLFLADKKSLYPLLYRTGRLEAEVCRRIGRGLTEREIEVFFLDGDAADPCKI